MCRSNTSSIFFLIPFFTWTSAFFLLLFLSPLLLQSQSVDAVHGHHILRKAAQQRQTEDAELEEELDQDAEEEDLLDQFISRSLSSPARNSVRQNSKEQLNFGGRLTRREQQSGGGSFFEQGETRDFLQFLRRIRYDHRQCPQNGGKAVLISVSVVVSNVRAVSEVTMDYSLEMFYRESWLDERLHYDMREFRNKTELALHESYANFLWHPDTFMPNAIASKNPRKQSISHRSLLRLQSDGQILYSRRLSVVAECPMDLTLFPFDSQTCKLGIESYGYTSDQVHYGWSHGQRAALKLHKIRLPDFRIKEAFVTSQLESYATGNYSRLYVCFVFSRSAGFCFLQLIIPSTAVVITSWVSLWMENETSFQDMISIILTITFLLFSYNEVMPRVSYLKALDIWLAVCFMIVFLSLIKLALMKYMRQRIRSDAPLVRGERSLLSAMLPIVQMGGSFGGVRLSNATNRPPTPSQMCSFPMGDSVHRQQRQLQTRYQQQQEGSQSSVASGGGRRRTTATERSPSAGSSEEEWQRRRSRQSSALSAGLEMTLPATLPQIHHATMKRRLSSLSTPVIAPYQTPISTLAATAMNLPLSQSSLRQLQQQTLYQAQQQLQLQIQLQQTQLLHQAQLSALHEQRRKERHRKRQKERTRGAGKRNGGTSSAEDRGKKLLDLNENETKAKGFCKRSPVAAIRIGIESSSDSPDSTDSETNLPNVEARKVTNGFFCFDQFGNVEFSAQFMRRFHWISQMSFFFGFVLFCLYFFLVYPNSRSTSTDPACLREEAEWFASIPN